MPRPPPLVAAPALLVGEMFDMESDTSNIQFVMSDIDTGGLDPLLSALSEQLAARNTRVHLVVIGGSALLAMGLTDRPTQDVDVVAFVRNGELVMAEPMPDAVQEAALRVAADFGLKETWLNPGPTSLLEIGGLPEGFAERLTTVDYGTALSVSYASRFDQVQLKLYAFADRREPRDEADLRGLAPTPDELRAGAAWARTHNAPGPFDEELARALAAFGVEDVGRDD
jgi:Nucleotidyltransferase of unknown function (DUF6036)